VRNIPLQRENERKGEGPAEKGNGVFWGGFVVLGPCVGDNMTDSLDNHISPPHMDWIWGARTVQTVGFSGGCWARVYVRIFSYL
jgi:hypothetical protein